MSTKTNLSPGRWPKKGKVRYVRGKSGKWAKIKVYPI